jgi:hypothetical protein
MLTPSAFTRLYRPNTAQIDSKLDKDCLPSVKQGAGRVVYL